MTYLELPIELRAKLEATKTAYLQRSALVGSTEISDVLLLDGKLDEVERQKLLSKGYEYGSPAHWFEFVSKPYQGDDAKCLQLVNEALASV